VNAGQVGKVLGLSTIVSNSTGMLLAGVFCDRLTRSGRQDAPILIALIAAVGIASFGCLPTLMPNIDWVYAAIFVSGLTFNAYNGVGPMAVNQVTPNQYRATVSAVYLFVVNALGLGCGPLLVGVFNDHVFHDPSKIRYSLVIVVFAAATAAIALLALVRNAYRRKLAESARWQ
jgi:MFS family permease